MQKKIFFPKKKKFFIKKHLMEFELHIKLLLFHTNAGTDVHVRMQSYA